jgi:chromosome partitioning protein
VKKPIIIATANHKGGVGKTTGCLSISEALTRLGKSVLCVDLDPQSNLTLSLLGKETSDKKRRRKGVISFLKDPKNLDAVDIIHETHKEGLFIIPGEKRIDGEAYDMNILLGEGIKGYLRMENLFKEDIFKSFDFIFIDLPPSKDKIVANAMMAADYYLIPVEASDYCLDGIEELISFINEAKEYNDKLELLGMYMPIVDMRLGATKKLIKELKESLGDAFIDIGIPTNSKIPNLPLQKKTIFDLEKRFSKGQKEYLALAKEIIKRMSVSKGVSKEMEV